MEFKGISNGTSKTCSASARSWIYNRTILKDQIYLKKHFHTTRAWLAAIDHSWRKGLRREILNFYFQDTAPKSNNAWSAQLYTTKRLTYLRLPLDCGHVGVQCAYEGITKLSVTRLTPSSVYELSSAAKLKTLLPKKVRGLRKLLSSLNFKQYKTTRGTTFDYLVEWYQRCLYNICISDAASHIGRNKLASLTNLPGFDAINPLHGRNDMYQNSFRISSRYVRLLREITNNYSKIVWNAQLVLPALYE